MKLRFNFFSSYNLDFRKKLKGEILHAHVHFDVLLLFLLIIHKRMRDFCHIEFVSPAFR